MDEKPTSLQEDLKAQWKTMFIQIVLIDITVFKTIAENDECTKIHDILELSEEIKKQILQIFDDGITKPKQIIYALQ